MGYLGLCPVTHVPTGLLIGVRGLTEPGVHILLAPNWPGDSILLGPVPWEPIILGLIPGIILGRTSPGLTIICLRPNGTTARGDALPLAAVATLGTLPLNTDTGPGGALFLAVVSPATSTLSWPLAFTSPSLKSR